MEAVVKNNHILHFEDLLYRLGCTKTLDIIEKVKLNTEYSVKVDGKPSILFGNHNNQFFISTKSGFSKNPKIYTSETEINSIPDKELAYKLSCLFKTLKKDYNKVYQADVLWYDENTFNNASVSPNNTVYDLSSMLVHSNHERVLKRLIGLSVHTAYDSLGSFNIVSHEDFVNDSVCNFMNHVNHSLRISDLINDRLNNLSYEYVKNNASLLDNMLCNLNSSYCSIDKMMNSFVRNKINICDMTEYSLQGLCYTYFNKTLKAHYETLKSSAYKLKFSSLINEKLNIVNSALFLHFCKIYILLAKIRTTIYAAFHVNLDNVSDNTFHIANVQVKDLYGNESFHEGFVIKVDDVLIKFIDRVNFSYSNFILNE